jgi:transposase
LLGDYDSIVGTCKHLGGDPFAYLRDALPELFALSKELTGEPLLDGCRIAGC